MVDKMVLRTLLGPIIEFVLVIVIDSVVGVTATVAAAGIEPAIVSVLLDAETASYRLVEGTVPNWVAWANFTDQREINGWSFLKVVTNESYPDGVQAYAAGLAEGHVTTNLLYYHWMNTVPAQCQDTDSDTGYCERLSAYLHTNREWMKEQIEKNAASDPYWHQVDLILKQIQGLQDGCQNSFIRNVEEEDILQEYGFLFFNVWGEWPDLQAALNKSGSSTTGSRKPGSCSAFVKVLPNNSDLYVSHTTWYYYNYMIRILKKYQLHYHLTDQPGSPVVPGVNITFSSYPGAVLSLDDFHLISTGLATTETTLDIFNRTLWENVQPQSLFSFVRTTVANRLATDGQSWTNLLFKNNGWTYNNQWLVVDYKKFQPGEQYLDNGLLWVAEQVPGSTRSEDRTANLRRQSYWASYNLPYFQDIYELSGLPERYRTYGDYYSHENSSRANIFRRDHHKVVDTTSGLALMRYNDFRNDPYSICRNCSPAANAMSAVAARGDLNPSNGSYFLADLKHQAYGGIDTKLTDRRMFQRLQFLACAGPTHDQQPPFQWSKLENAGDISHMGHPDLWKFDPVLTEWE